MNKEHIIVSGVGSDERYVIPADKEKEWYEWLNTAKNGDLNIAPEFARSINGDLSRVKFQEYRID